MDHLPHLRRECAAFAATVRAGAAESPTLPSCPDWAMADLAAHLGWVHRYVLHIIVNRLQTEPDPTAIDPGPLPPDWQHWPNPTATTPFAGPVPASMLDWFAQGASLLADTFAGTDPTTRVVTWSAERSVGFWLRMQTIEAAVHRWDAQRGLGAPEPIDAELAADSIEHTIEIMLPWRRQRGTVPAGAGERYRFRATDLDTAWTVEFDGDTVRAVDGPGDVQVAGSASEVALFRWGRLPAERLAVSGEKTVLDRLFALAPSL